MPRIQPTYVYFIRRKDGIGPIKIGSTRNVKNRLSGIQVGNPYKLKVIKEIYGEEFLEKQYHKKFDNLKLIGEWFKPDGRLLEFISNLIEDASYVTARKYFNNKEIKIEGIKQFFLLDDRMIYYPLTHEWQNYTHNKQWHKSLNVRHFYTTYFNPSEKEIERQLIVKKEKEEHGYWYNENIAKIYKIANNCNVKPETVIRVVLKKERMINELTEEEISYVLNNRSIIYKRHKALIIKKANNKTLDTSDKHLFQMLFS